MKGISWGNGREGEWLERIATNLDIVVLVYLPAEGTVQYVSDSVRWLIGVRKEQIYRDIRCLFDQLNIQSEDEQFVEDFLCGNLLLSIQKEYEFTYSNAQNKRWGRIKAVPCDDGSYLLTLSDTTVEHELSEALITAVEKIDHMRGMTQDMLADDVDVKEIHTVFEEPSPKKWGDSMMKQRVSAPCYEGKRALLVEDNEINREIACELLRQLGVMIEQAENGIEAVGMFADSEEDYYDLIFMDIQMPVMDGNEATRKIRAMDRKDAKVIPIIAMTAHIFAEDIQMALQAGMDIHIAKPLNVQKMLEGLRKIKNTSDAK